MRWHVDELRPGVVVTIPHGAVRLTEEQLKAMVKAVNDERGKERRRPMHEVGGKL